MIEKRGDEYVVLSGSGRVLGTYDTEEAAEQKQKHVEEFKGLSEEEALAVLLDILNEEKELDDEIDDEFIPDMEGLRELMGVLKVTYENLHVLHRNVEGENFEQIHELLSDYYEEIEDIKDDIIEISLSMGYDEPSMSDSLQYCEEIPTTSKFDEKEALEMVKTSFMKIHGLMETVKASLPSDVAAKFDEYQYYLRKEANYKIAQRLERTVNESLEASQDLEAMYGDAIEEPEMQGLEYLQDEELNEATQGSKYIYKYANQSMKPYAKTKRQINYSKKEDISEDNEKPITNDNITKIKYGVNESLNLEEKSESKVNAAGNYTKPGMRKKLFKKIMAGSKGGDPGEWSARKAQLLAREYKKAGGGYKD